MLMNKSGEDFQVKLIDFGMATKYEPNEKLSKVQGTPYYIAPEVIGGMYDSKADVWS